MNSALTKVAMYSGVLCLISFFWLGTINSRVADLHSEIKGQQEWGNVAVMCMKSIWNGITLGAFSDGDIFAENTKLDNWNQAVRQRAARLNIEFSIATTLRNITLFSCLTSLAIGGALYYRQRQKTAEPEKSSPSI